MGLTINFELKAPEDCDFAGARRLVVAAREEALRLHRAGKVDSVGPLIDRVSRCFWLSEWIQVRVPQEDNTMRGIEVPAEEGAFFTVTLGKDSETLNLGLCRYPAQVYDFDNCTMRKIRRSGWRLRSFCKTQYASLHGWDHFERCHVAAIDLISYWRSLGVRVAIKDEGGYWPRRNVANLRGSLDQMNGIVAALGGALKDVSDESSPMSPVQSPIFDHPEFERLEAKGEARHSGKLKGAIAAVRKHLGL